MAGNKRVTIRKGAWEHALSWSVIAIALSYMGVSIWRPGWHLILAAVVAGVVACVGGGLFAESPSMGLWGGLWGVVATLWVTALWWFSYSPWHLIAFLGLTGPAVILVPAGAYLLSVDAGYLAQLRAKDEERAAAKKLSRYGKVLAGIGLAGITAEEETISGGLRLVELRLPEEGRITFDTLTAAKDDIERAMRLRRDALRFEEHASDSSWVTMHIVETAVLNTDLPVPDLPAVLSINDPLPVGQVESGAVFDVLFRERGLAIFGLSGMGKSNLLNVLIALFSRCEDVILWVIDMKGGRLAAPWIEPWVKGECDRPAIDWVATTREEAEVMLLAGERWMDARTRSLSGGSKLIPSRAHPQLVILMDEGADLTGRDLTRREGMTNREFDALIARVARKQRSEAVMFGGAWQRGIATHLSSDIKSQLHISMALPVTDLAEARSVLPDDSYSQRLLVGLPIGSVLIRAGKDARPLPVKAYRLDPGDDSPHGPHDRARVRQFAVASSRVRPEPDETDLKAMGETWPKRWENSELYLQLGGKGKEVVVVPDRERPAPKMPADQVAERFAELTGGPDMADLATPAEGGGHPARLRILALLADRPFHGIGAGEALTVLKAEGIGVDPSTFYKWMREYVTAGTVQQVGQGKGRRWKLTKISH